MRHKCLAGFIVSILYLTVSTAIMFAEMRALAKAEILNRTLAESKIYENAPKYLETLYAKNQQIEPQTKILVTGIVESFDPKIAKREVEKNTAPALDYLKGKTSEPNVSFDLRDLKKNLKINLPDIFAEEIANLPSCPAGVKAPPRSEGLPECIPAGASTDQIKQGMEVSSYTDEIMSEIPDFYNLNDLKNKEKVFASAKLGFKILNIGFYTSIITSLILILFLVLLGKGWWPSIPRWVGLSLVLPAGSLLILNIFSKILPGILSNQLSQSVDPEIIKMLNPLIEAVNISTLRISFIYSGTVFALGSVLILLSYILPHPPEPKPAAATKPAPAPNPPLNK